ncbi:ABC transporter ATP-binding protein [Algoriphagus formosus]|uniref:ATP-binding cassette domain-containing protein n=1 Tax=Algoriphagus formosus TaxID=2007308 RepID=A0A4R5UW78_9BACT|nr:ABC transporter ATP-binding protein [Algoriphagus aquimaris]TDK43316.1 ATP-binding cassette domain-containing protein [Algoriphagus aquimaris]
MRPVISVSSLSKRYRLGLKEKQAETLAGQIANVIKSPWKNLKKLKDLSRFGLEDDSVFWALKDVSFEVQEGEVLGIIGKNGAGKSTLLKILSQITEPTSGKIEIHGRVASLLEVGTGFHPELSGRENIYMNGTILGMTRREIDSKLDEIIDFSGVEKFIDTPVKFYSSGMKVRLGFSVAAHLDPEILIIDEVLAVGDYEFQKKCVGKMGDVSKNQGRTVLFVSHNMGAIQKLCQKSILLESGIIVTNEITSVVLEKYFGKEEEKKYQRTKNEEKKEYSIDSAQLTDSLGNPKNSFFHDSGFIVCVKVTEKIKINEVYLFVTILDSNLNKIFSAEQKVIGSKQYKLFVKEKFLTRGNYSIQLILYKPGISQFDFIEQTCHFEIIDSGSDFVHLNSFDYGVVFGNYEWIN